MNVFQGTFPAQNTQADGFAGTAPVATFEPNGYGLHQMTGNAWEWTADWFDPGFYVRSPRTNPRGAETGAAKVMTKNPFNGRIKLDIRDSTPDWEPFLAPQASEDVRAGDVRG